MTKATKPRHRWPYLAIDHRVVDSEAFAGLSFSAKALLLLLARQLSKDNNGHLQASFGWCKRFGFGSEHTLRKAIAELIAVGFIYRTRSWGANRAWATYAVTWLPIKKSDGLFLAGFKTFAWRQSGDMPNGKSSRHKMPDQSGILCSFTPEVPAVSAGMTPANSAVYELIPIPIANYGGWIVGELARLAACGLGGQQCFMVQR